MTEVWDAGGYFTEDTLKNMSAHNLICTCLTNKIDIDFKFYKNKESEDLKLKTYIKAIIEVLKEEK